MSERDINGTIRKLEERIAKLERGARGPQRFAKSGVGGGGAKLVKIKEGGLKDNHLECQWWNEATDTLGADVLVAKPYWFRLSTYMDEEINDITYEHVTINAATGLQRRRATYSGNTLETQQITPYYFEGAVLAVEKSNGTLSLRADQLSEDDPPVMVSCQWVDRNDEPRAWTT